MREFVVFYAWQSDRPARFNRYLIRIALNLAAENISNDPAVGVRVRIDADTEGILGHVPVTETILKKIERCDVFAPDLTFVAQADSGKLIPNPNVMLEYGYALHAKTHSALMPVMNSAYGGPDKLPFDMGHLRHPLHYNLPATADNAARRQVRKKITEDFEGILRLMIAQTPSEQNTAVPFHKTPEVRPAFFFPQNASIASFGEHGEQEYQFDGDRVIYLRFFPKSASNQPIVGRALLKEIFNFRRTIKPMARAGGGISSTNRYGWVVIDGRSNDTAKGITQGFISGELWGLNSEAFHAFSFSTYAGEQAAIGLGVISVEKLLARALENYAIVATTEMKLQPPFMIEVGAVGLSGAFMGAPHPDFTNGHYYGPIHEDALLRQYELADTRPTTLMDRLRQFLDELYDLAECRRSEVLTDSIVKVNMLPPRT